MSALGEDDRIVVRCKGKGCPIKTRRPKPPNGGGDLSYGKPFKPTSHPGAKSAKPWAPRPEGERAERGAAKPFAKAKPKFKAKPNAKGKPKF